MRVSRPAHRAVSILCVSAALVACSGDLSAQANKADQVQHVPTVPPTPSESWAAAVAIGGSIG